MRSQEQKAVRFEEQYNSASQELEAATRKLKLTEGELFNKSVECMNAKDNSKGDAANARLDSRSEISGVSI